MNLKDLKQAQVKAINFDSDTTKRPIAFDFNSMIELQELGYNDPLEVIQGMETMNLKSIRELLYACLKSGHLTAGTGEFDLTQSDIGTVVGYYMARDNDGFQAIFDELASAITAFFPEPKTEEEAKEADSAQVSVVDPKN